MEINNQSKNGIKAIIRLSVMLLVLIIMVVSFAYSWFFNNKEATVNEFKINVVEAYNLLIKMEGTDEWVKSLDLKFENFKFNPVAGNGEDFYNQNMVPTDNPIDTGNGFNIYGVIPGDYEAISVETTEDLKSNGIYTVDFAFKIEKDCRLYLTGDSSAKPASIDENGTVKNKSDNIAGAVRIAFLKQIATEEGETAGDGTEGTEPTKTYQLVAVWAPDVTTELQADGTVVVGTMENIKIVTPDADGKPTEQTITVSADTNMSEIGGVTYIWGPITEGNRVPLTNITSAEEGNNFRVVIWVDGNDRECTNALIDGIVSLQMNFAVDDIPEETKE